MNKQKGFTLIEVLVALAILAIALTALLQNTASIVQTNRRLDESLMKHWVAMQAINAIQLGIVSVENNALATHSYQLFGQTWYWQAQSQTTFIKTMREIHVRVSEQKMGPFKEVLVGFRHE